MWKCGQKVTVSAYNKHKYTVKKCQTECHRIIGVTQREKFKEARENLPENCYLFNEEALDVSRAQLQVYASK